MFRRIAAVLILAVLCMGEFVMLLYRPAPFWILSGFITFIFAALVMTKHDRFFQHRWIVAAVLALVISSGMLVAALSGEGPDRLAGTIFGFLYFGLIMLFCWMFDRLWRRAR